MKINYNEYILSKEEKIKYYIVTFVVSVILSILLYDNILFVIIFLPIIVFGKNLFVKRKIKQRKKDLLLEFKDFLYLISTSFSLGRTMTQAMEESIKSLITIYGEKSLLARELEDILLEMEEANDSEIELLKDFAIRTSMEDIQDFIQVYESCKTAGGDIIDGVNSAAKIIADKITIEEEIKSSTSQKKMEGRMISLAPFIIILFLKITSPDYIKVMYETFAGRIIMSITLGAVVLAIIITERITKIEI